MLYPERLAGRLGRLTFDILAVLWTGASALAGWETYRLVLTLEVLADSITSTGRTFDRWIQAFRHATPAFIPGLSGALSNLATSLQRSTGDALVRNGMLAHERIQELAVVLGVTVAVVPILVVTGSYLVWRARDVREMSAAADFVHAAERSGRVAEARAVLAHRAIAMLPFRQLMQASADPVGDLEEGRYDALADAMLRRSGVRPSRLSRVQPDEDVRSLSGQTSEQRR